MSENQTAVVKFLNYLSNPDAIGASDLTDVKDWVTKYPYSQSLKFITLKAVQNNANYQDLLAQAATIAPSRKLLHDFIHQTESFNTTVLPFTIDDVQTIEERQIAVAQEETIQETEEPSKLSFGIDINEIYGSDYQTEEKEQDSPVENIQEETQENEQFLASADEEIIVETEEDPEIGNIEEEKQEEVLASAEEDQIEELQEKEDESEVENILEEKQEEVLASFDEVLVDQTEEVSEVENFEEENQEEISASADEEVIVEVKEEIEVENIEEEEKQEEVLASADEEQIEEVQETEDEFVVGNIEEEKQDEVLAFADEEVVVEIEEESTVENIEEEKQEEILATAEEEVEEEPSVENIEEVTFKEEEIQKEEPAFQYAPQTDFFALNRKDKVEEKEPQDVVEAQTNAEESVSAYNDERMPYTFLWWLNKTRKEHATNLQPYSSFKLDTSKQIKKQETDGLNHQIAENIFHLRGVEELSSSASNYTVPFDFRKKEFQIIEKFIKEEPQIRPPAANKIDSENKAKKSSEDKNLVVSETLAKIYVEQMLYHKALDVYKKLSLKFPEKSTYFASQIKYLELKVN